MILFSNCTSYGKNRKRIRKSAERLQKEAQAQENGALQSKEVMEVNPVLEANILKACIDKLDDYVSKSLHIIKPLPILNQCPTLNNKINCSECTHECKLRMQLEQSKEDIPPEYPPAVIYY